MNARFDLARSEQAPRAAARLVSDLLTEWQIYGAELRTKVRVATTALVAEVLLADASPVLTVHVEYAGTGLQVAVTGPGPAPAPCRRPTASTSTSPMTLPARSPISRWLLPSATPRAARPPAPRRPSPPAG